MCACACVCCEWLLLILIKGARCSLPSEILLSVLCCVFWVRGLACGGGMRDRGNIMSLPWQLDHTLISIQSQWITLLSESFLTPAVNALTNAEVRSIILRYFHVSNRFKYMLNPHNTAQDNFDFAFSNPNNYRLYFVCKSISTKNSFI